MPMVPLVTDVHADVVEQRRVLQPFPLCVAEAVHAPRLVEHGEAELRDVSGVADRVSAPLGQLDHASPAYVGIAIDLPDVPRVALDVIQYQAFAQREVAQRQLGCIETTKQKIQEHGTRDDDVRAPRV